MADDPNPGSNHPADYEPYEDADWQSDDGLPDFECPRYRIGRRWHCPLAGTEDCDWECPDR